MPAVSRELLTPERAAVAAELRNVWMDSQFPGVYHRVEQISATNDTEVYRMSRSSGRTVIAKFHNDQYAYSRELLALTVWADTGRVPRLVGQPLTEAQVLLMEYLPKSSESNVNSDILSSSFALGVLHADARMKLSAIDIQILADQPTDDEAIFVEQNNEVYSVLDFGISVSLGDRKPEHVRFRSGMCVMIDLESIRLGGLELVDLIDVVAWACKPCGTLVEQAAQAYCAGWLTRAEPCPNPHNVEDALKAALVLAR